MTRRTFVRALLIAALLFVLPASQAWAAAKFWVGGTGNLDGVDTTHISDTSGGAGGATYPAAGDTLTFDGASGGGTVTVTAAVNMTSWVSGAHTGTIDTNGQTITLSQGWQGSGSGTRTVTLGSSALNFVSVWAWGTTTNLTFNANTSTITLSAMSANQFQGGGLTYSTVAIGNSGAGGITGANTFGALTITGSAAKTNEMSLAANQTVTGTLTINGNSSVNRVLVSSDTRGTARTITAATVSVTNADFQDITGAGAGSWDLSAITGLSGDCGGNSGITFTTSAPQYWQHGASASYNWSDSTRWFLATNGGGGAGRVPLPQDTAYFDANSFAASGKTVVQDMPRIGTVDWTGATNTPTWTTSTAASFFGSITLASGMTLTASTETYIYEGRGASTLTSAGKTWAKSFQNKAPGGTLTLGDAFVGSGDFLQAFSSTFNTGGFSVSLGRLTTSAWTGTINLGSSTITITTGSTSWILLSGGTLIAASATIVFSFAATADYTFAGGGYTYGNLTVNTTGAFSLLITGSNTFTDGIYVDASAAARTIQFTAATTTTVGRMGRLDSTTNTITIGSTTAAAHTLARLAGSPYKTVIENASISQSTVTANAFYAPGGTDGGSNTNWIFGRPSQGVIIP